MGKMVEKFQYYIFCETCGRELKFIKKSKSGRSFFKPCLYCEAAAFARGYEKAQSIYKEIYIKKKTNMTHESVDSPQFKKGVIMNNIKHKHIGYIADRIVEECGEVIQAVMKGKRFGWDKYHPDKPKISNMQQLSMEIDDVLEAFKNLKESLD
jgi:hypothetical protein